MSVSYSDIRRFDLPQQPLLIVCRNIFAGMGLNLVYESDGYLIGHILVLAGKSCDIVTTYVREIGSVLVTSENKFQDFDGGRNRKMVETLFNKLEAGIEKFSIQNMEGCRR